MVEGKIFELGGGFCGGSGDGGGGDFEVGGRVCCEDGVVVFKQQCRFSVKFEPDAGRFNVGAHLFGMVR